MGSRCFTREETGQHSRNVSYPCWHAGLRKTSGSDVDSLGETPRLSCDRSSKAVELIKEISALEYEIEHLEQHLLFLYRTVFNRRSTDSPAIEQRIKLSSNSCTDSQFECDQHLVEYPTISTEVTNSAQDNKLHANKKLHRPGNEYCREVARDEYNLRKDYLLARAISNFSYLSEGTPKKEKEVTSTRGRTLGDHLCGSLKKNAQETPCELSENIIRCISAVYCKLNDARVSQTALSSPFSSRSSFSSFSLQDRSENWSPRCNSEITQSPLKEKYNSCLGTIEVCRISIDKDRFKCAAVLLERHRNLVKRLETVDPSKMGDEDRLAFWLNIHNALVMHAFIAYGLENNHIRSTPLILKKSYNVGGTNLNAFEIRSSIIGCSPHRKNSISIFSNSTKSTTPNNNHPFALKQPQHLVHFALSMGAYSDPPVRAYTARTVTKQLEIAKEEFIQANVSINKENKIMLPKILELYAKDASLDLPSLLEVVHDCLPRDRQHLFRECLKGRKLDRCTKWSPYRSTFRYILNKELDMNKQ